ncbi:MAG: S41 family peptidase, partial [Candidatus Gastranaerophilales bacterium]|nr:S41 family peptidase [Candidatus Gastranaerophilales bacterium]
NGNIKVEDVIENSPAYKNGLKVNDIILKIDGSSAAGQDIKKIASMIRGKKGTKVKLLILRDKSELEKLITRDDIVLKSVSYKIINKDIAYIKINTFMSETTAKEFIDALTQTKTAKKVIIDLRNNSGGLLQNAIFISNILLKEGVIVSVWSKTNKEITKVQGAGLHDDRPLAVLTNGLTASASEILAAALQDNNRAVLVGEKTYGKGIIQRITPLPLNTAMNVTIAKYLTPGGNDIHKNGIKPDWEVKYTVDDAKKKLDPQLDKAVEVLNSF